MEYASLILEYIKVIAWPLTTLALVWSFRKQIIELMGRLHHADLPGGVSIDLQRAVDETQQLSNRIQSTGPTEQQKKHPSIPLTEANSRMIALGLQPSPSGLDLSYYQTLAEQDPNVALAGLRIELDILAKNLAKGFKIETAKNESGIRLLRRLHEEHAVTSDQTELATRILEVCNAAVHGTPVSLGEALTVLDSTKALIDQYLSWLSWGFGGGWQPTFLHANNCP